VGEETAAWNYGFQYHDSWFWYQPTMGTKFQQFSPGFCLLSKIVEDACGDSQLTCVDLGLGAEGYKERLSNHARQTLHVTATRSSAHYLKTALAYQAARDRARTFGDRWKRLGFAASLRWALNRMWQALVSDEEVTFFEWPGSRYGEEQRNRLTVTPLNWELLAEAAMHFADDSETMTYLLRAAKRLGSKSAAGYALIDENGNPVHFAWVGEFDGFFMAELQHRLTAPGERCVLLFDCWTPTLLRGHGYYATAIAALAKQFAVEGKSPWIFSAATNSASLRGVTQAGFQPRFSLTRSRRFLKNRISKSDSGLAIEQMANVSAA
jgi:hypothetical protein